MYYAFRSAEDFAVAQDTRSNMLSVLTKYPKAVTHLRSRFKNNQFSMVLGSGVSRDFNIPDWEGLVSGIASHASVRAKELYDKEKGQQSLAALADLLRRSFEERRITELGRGDVPDRRVRNQLKGEWLNVIREVLYEKCPNQDELERVHPYLGEFLELIIKCRITVNYNFDSCLEMMIDHRRQGSGQRGYNVVHDIPTFSGADSAILYHPNGFIPRNPLDQSSTQIVFSEQEFGDQLMDSIVGRYTALANLLGQSTCLFVGLSIRDDTLRHLLRKSSLSNPGQYHYCVQWVRDFGKMGGERQDDLHRLMCQFWFETYNLITLFLTNSELAGLGKLIRLEQREFLELCDESGVQPLFVYYLTGVPGAGKTSTVSYMRNLETLGEWLEEPLPELSIPFTKLNPDQVRKIDEWIARQFALKNRQLQLQPEGIYLVDRCPLDPITFAKPERRSLSASLLKGRIAEENRKGLRAGQVLMLVGSAEELATRLAIQKPSSYSPEQIGPMQEDLRRLYRPLRPSEMETTGLSLSEVVKTVSRRIHQSEYLPADLWSELNQIADDTKPVTS